VEIIDPEAGGRRALRQDSPPTVSGRDLALLPIAEVLSCQAAGMVLLDGRQPAEVTAGHVRGAVSIGLGGRLRRMRWRRIAARP
jgi:hypothetical protein